MSTASLDVIPADSRTAGDPLGYVDLRLPPDWCDVLIAPDEQTGVRAHLAELVDLTWPSASAEFRAGCVDVLTAWRGAMLARGVVSHGLVNGAMPDGAPARWQVLTSVVPLPAEPDVDLGAVIAELVQVQEPDVLHVERYTTDMGLGVGLISQPEIQPPDGLGGLERLGLEVRDEPVRVGVAAALAWEPGADRGLLVVGCCLAPEQVVELAGLVAVIAGRSRLRVAGQAPAEQ